MYKITAPAEGFNGMVGGVEFKDSVAETDNEQVVAYCRRAGYTVEPAAAVEAEVVVKPAKG